LSLQTAPAPIRPHEGPQCEFLTTPADIAILGGSAGGGKTWSLLLDDLYHIENPLYRSIMFRRVSPQITNPGGLWDEANGLYRRIRGAMPNRNQLEWRFKSGAVVKFAHMQYEDTKYDFQGAQVAKLAFDELTHFSIDQFFYLISRTRSVSGIRPYVRATCNADADSWVADFISWWIDQETGYPIPERSGVLRWFVRVEGELHWADDPYDLSWIEVEGVKQPPKSLTFIPAKVTDNPTLLRINPEYLANLLALPLVEQARLLHGNWKVREAAGTVFRREWFETIEAAPPHANRVRFWDFAATEPSRENRDPDWTVGALVGRTHEGLYFIEDIRRIRATPGEVERFVRQTASEDGVRIPVHFEQEPGSSGKQVAHDMISRVLAGYAVYAKPSTGSKRERARPVSAQALARNLVLVRAGAENWHPAWLNEASAFPDGPHDDQVDAVSGAFSVLTAPAVTGNRTAVSAPRPAVSYTPR
jgi:predicted phage terminase large subunit-like protein